jgi:hypothetical protein
MDIATALDGVKVIEDLDNATVLQIEDDQPGLGRFEAALPREVIDNSEHRLPGIARVFQGVMD